MSVKFYTAFGRLTSAFAHLEADLRFLIAGLAFRGEAVTAAAFMDGTMLRENLTTLRKLSRQYWDAEIKICEIVDRIEKIRPKRNFFIHGLWSAGNFGENGGFATVRVLRTTFEESDHTRKWTHGQSENFAMDDFQVILDEVNAISIEIEKLFAWFEEHENVEFRYFGGTSMSKPTRFANNPDGSLPPPHAV